MDKVELEGRPPRQPLMLKEWLELEYSAELSRDGFGCYPRHLATEPRSAGCRRSHVIARVSAAVRAALSRTPSSARQVEAAAPALHGSLPTRLRAVGFWKKRRREMEETDRSPVASCSATTAASSGRRDGACSLATSSPRRMGQENRQAGGDRANGCECEATCHLDEEREQEQRLSPVSVMEFQSQDGDDDCSDVDSGHSEDEGTSPTFERSLANIQRASQQLLKMIRRFEQLAELDTPDMDNAVKAADDMSRHVGELDSVQDNQNAERGLVQVQQDLLVMFAAPTSGFNPATAAASTVFLSLWITPATVDCSRCSRKSSAAEQLLGLPEAGSPLPCPAHRFKMLLEDFFREGLSPCHDGGSSDDPELEMSLLKTAKAWLDGRRCALIRSDQEAEVDEIERLGRWRCFREDERDLMSSDVEGGIFCCLVEELVEDLC